ncbi:tryptophan synthase subunit alpha [Nonomuraea lactucae]|uniref:tryptophan synthase subunit alpha n=1 Tax=Nonomuraea lactucae TaxID=2249762 RepID=UPI000DE52213|nr:tryptophan synthase subunit alpha [Nonomuraea lactucae]
MSRYAAMFESARAERSAPVIAWSVVGDPTPETWLDTVDALVSAGAAALELSIAFSDPSADGPVNQGAYSRVLGKVDKNHAVALIKQVRERYPDLPIGLMTYANLVYIPSPEAFYAACAAAGVDSVLVADVPVHEVEIFSDRAAAHDIEMVLIAPPNAQEPELKAIAEQSQGFVYLVSRAGVTGTDREAQSPLKSVIATLKKYGAPPTVLGFGISRAEHVRNAIAAGADGVVVGSAFAKLVAEHLDDPAALTAASTGLVTNLRSGAGIERAAPR